MVAIQLITVMVAIHGPSLNQLITVMEAIHGPSLITVMVAINGPSLVEAELMLPADNANLRWPC
jgi:hypothetical protein